MANQYGKIVKLFWVKVSQINLGQKYPMKMKKYQINMGQNCQINMGQNVKLIWVKILSFIFHFHRKKLKILSRSVKE